MNHSPTILFDGVCNFCNSAVIFTLRQDKQQALRFAALQSAAGQQLLQEHQLPQRDYHSFFFIEADKVYSSSTAALRVSHYFPWYWQWLRIFWIVPPFIRNGVYNFIARNRYRWFGKREACMIPTPEIRQRFLS